MPEGRIRSFWFVYQIELGLGTVQKRQIFLEGKRSLSDFLFLLSSLRP